MEEFRFNLEDAISNKLTFEEYSLLYLIYYSQERLLVEYVTHIAKISTETFKKLEDLEYLTIKDYSNITFDIIKLTSQAENLFAKGSNTKEEFNECFEELKKVYPISVVRDRGKSRLQGNLDRCKRLYSETIFKNKVLDKELHNLIIKIIPLYSKESDKYIQLLETFLSKKNWQQYIEDVKNGVLVTIKQNFDAI